VTANTFSDAYANLQVIPEFAWSYNLKSVDTVIRKFHQVEMDKQWVAEATF